MEVRGDFVHGEGLGIGQAAPLTSHMLPPGRFMETFSNVHFETRDTLLSRIGRPNFGRVPESPRGVLRLAQTVIEDRVTPQTATCLTTLEASLRGWDN